jgi:hypothetical protein
MPTGTAALPVTVVGAVITPAPAVVLRLVAVKTLTRFLGLNHGVRPTLNRQPALTILQLTLLLLLLLLTALLLLHLLALLLLLLLLLALVVAQVALTFLLLALLIGALLLILLNLPILLQLFLLALLLLLLLLLLRLLLALLLLLTLLIVGKAALILLLLALHLEAALLLLTLLLLLLLLLIIVVGQHLSTDAQGQETDTCQTPDAHIHAFLTAARIPMDRTAGRVRRSPHSISVANETLEAHAPFSAEIRAQKKRAQWPSLEYFVLARRF